MKAALVLLAACGTVASPDNGLGRALYVDDAQFRPGAFPAATGGPAAFTAQPTHSTVVAGSNREVVTGAFEGTATGAILGIDGWPGTWIVTAGPPPIDMPGAASLSATFALSDAFPPQPFTLLVAGVDAAGRIGEPFGVDLLALPDVPPSGELVVGLVWQNHADLDLHVIDPLGNEIWRGDPNSWHPPPPGDPIDPNAWKTGGILDHDTNAHCVLGGDLEEDVIWTRRGETGPDPIVPPGEYTVRVDAQSMCEDASAPWTVFVTHRGETIGAARGIATPDDADSPHTKGSGVTALTFTIP